MEKWREGGRKEGGREEEVEVVVTVDMEEKGEWMDREEADFEKKEGREGEESWDEK